MSSPWIIVRGNDKKRARLESIRHVLSTIDYGGRSHRRSSDRRSAARRPTPLRVRE